MHNAVQSIVNDQLEPAVPLGESRLFDDAAHTSGTQPVARAAPSASQRTSQTPSTRGVGAARVPSQEEEACAQPIAGHDTTAGFTGGRKPPSYGDHTPPSATAAAVIAADAAAATKALPLALAPPPVRGSDGMRVLVIAKFFHELLLDAELPPRINGTQNKRPAAKRRCHPVLTPSLALCTRPRRCRRRPALHVMQSVGYRCRVGS